MHQIKIFKGLESDLASLEADVNAWLASSGVMVVQIAGNIAPQSALADGGRSPGLPSGAYLPSDVLLIVHYSVHSSQAG